MNLDIVKNIKAGHIISMEQFHLPSDEEIVAAYDQGKSPPSSFFTKRLENWLNESSGESFQIF